MMQQPGPQRSSSSMIWIILALVGGVLLCCCGSGVAYFMLVKTRAADIAPVPVPPPVSSAEPVIPDSAGSGPAPTTDQNMTVTLTVDTATGVPGVTPGSTCTFPIVYHANSGDLNCQAHATCGGVALYGDTETNGFFPCTFSLSPPSIHGADNGTSAADQDPSFVIDSATGMLIIADDSTGHHGAFSVSGHVRVQ